MGTRETSQGMGQKGAGSVNVTQVGLTWQCIDISHSYLSNTHLLALVRAKNIK